MKTALIMEGGAMRGMFTCGVMDVLMENGIAFDGAAGISAGAVFGCNFKSEQIGRPVRYNKKILQGSEILQYPFLAENRRSVRRGFLLPGTAGCTGSL